MSTAYSEKDLPNEKLQRITCRDEFVLEKVLGTSSFSKDAFAGNPVTGTVAYPAACILVLLDPKTSEQNYIENSNGRSISSVAFSEDGSQLAFGEHGRQPGVSVWLVNEHKEISKFHVDETVGIKSLSFHPRSPVLALFTCHSFRIEIWSIKSGKRCAVANWQTAPLACTIPQMGTTLITCGHRKITLFDLEKVCSNHYETNVLMDKRTVLLGRQSEYTFVDICSGKGKHVKDVYTITACGYLCEIKLGDILIDKAAKIDKKTFCIKYGIDQIFVGCPKGIVKICSPENLSTTAAVSLSHMLGLQPGEKDKCGRNADTYALVINETDSIVTSIYADCSMHSWQVRGSQDTIECSAIVPAAENSFAMLGDGSEAQATNGLGYNDHIYRASILRSFKSFSGHSHASLLSDPNALASRHQSHGYYGVLHTFHDNHSTYQHVQAIRISPDGKEVICGNDWGEIKVYDAKSKDLKRVIEAHSAPVTMIELMYDSQFRLVASGGRDRIIFVLDASNDFSLVQVLCDHSAAITSISMVHSNNVLALVSAAADGVILVRRAIPGATLKFTITGEVADSHGKQFLDVKGDFIAAGQKSGNIKVFKADPAFSGRPLVTIKDWRMGTGSFKTIDIDPSGSFVVASKTNGQISVFHLQTGQPVASLTSQEGSTLVKFTNNMRYMVSSSHNCALVWRLPERMTEYMRTRLEKVVQVETAREISYETYLSCLRVCQETSMSDTGTQSSFTPLDHSMPDPIKPSWNSEEDEDAEGEEDEEEKEGKEEEVGEPPKTKPQEEEQKQLNQSQLQQHQQKLRQCAPYAKAEVWANASAKSEATPSIQSLHLMDASPSVEEGRFSWCSSDSFLSCSTCSGSQSSETFFNYPQSESSLQVQSLPPGAYHKSWGAVVKCIKSNTGEEEGSSRTEKLSREPSRERSVTKREASPDVTKFSPVPGDHAGDGSKKAKSETNVCQDKSKGNHTETKADGTVGRNPEGKACKKIKSIGEVMKNVVDSPEESTLLSGDFESTERTMNKLKAHSPPPQLHRTPSKENLVENSGLNQQIMAEGIDKADRISLSQTSLGKNENKCVPNKLYSDVSSLGGNFLSRSLLNACKDTVSVERRSKSELLKDDSFNYDVESIDNSRLSEFFLSKEVGGSTESLDNLVRENRDTIRRTSVWDKLGNREMRATHREEKDVINNKAEDGAGDENNIDGKLSESETAYNYHSILRDETGTLRRVDDKMLSSINYNPKCETKVCTTAGLKEAVVPTKPPVNPDRRSFPAIEMRSGLNSLDKSCTMCQWHKPRLSPEFKDCVISKTSLMGLCGSCQELLNKGQLGKYYSHFRCCMQLSNSQETFYRWRYDCTDSELMDMLNATKGNKTTYLSNLCQSESEASLEDMATSLEEGKSRCVTPSSPEVKCFKSRLSPLSCRGSPNTYKSAENERKSKSPNTVAFNREADAIEIIQVMNEILENRRTPQPAMPTTTCDKEGNESKANEMYSETKEQCQESTMDVVFSKLLQSKLEIEKSGDSNESAPISQLLAGVEPQLTSSSFDAFFQMGQITKSIRSDAQDTVSFSRQFKEAFRRQHHVSSVANGQLFSDLGYFVPDSPKVHDSSVAKDHNTKEEPPCRSRLPHLQSASPEIQSKLLISRSVPHDIEAKVRQAPAGVAEKKVKIFKDLERASSPLALAGDEGGLLNATAQPPRDTALSSTRGGVLQARSPTSADKTTRRETITPRFQAPVMELFRDQDDYLQKLKEVRENFELSIQALSDERKSQRAASQGHGLLDTFHY